MNHQVGFCRVSNRLLELIKVKLQRVIKEQKLNNTSTLKNSYYSIKVKTAKAYPKQISGF